MKKNFFVVKHIWETLDSIKSCQFLHCKTFQSLYSEGVEGMNMSIMYRPYLLNHGFLLSKKVPSLKHILENTFLKYKKVSYIVSGIC